MWFGDATSALMPQMSLPSKVDGRLIWGMSIMLPCQGNRFGTEKTSCRINTPKTNELETSMYLVITTALMLVFPLASIAIESLALGVPLTTMLVLKWFVFWSVGVRLFLAGIKQITQPQYTAKVILGLQSDESLILVRELGFANLSIGLIGILSYFEPSWLLAAAIAGGMFYGLAGMNHVLQKHRNRLENIAMVTDLFAASVLLVACAIAMFAK